MGFDKRAKATEYKPKDGDTLESIAERESAAGNPLTAADLARFNWGTDDPDVMDEFMRDELGCYERGEDNRFRISADIDVRTPLAIPNAFQLTGLALRRPHVLRVRRPATPPKQFEGCASISGVTFEFDKSFVRPSVVDDLQTVEVALNEHPEAKIIVFGHTDKVGSDDYNKKLSERRARSVYAFITNQPDIWEELYKQENWGLRSVQMILKDLGGAYDPGAVDGINGSRTKAAVKAFQRDNGLAEDGVAGTNTRKALFEAYMAGKHDVEIDDDRFMPPKHMGCGEFNPVVETEDPCEPNRRVTFYMFHTDRQPRLPCKAGSTTPCKRQQKPRMPRHRDEFSCSFYDSIARECGRDSVTPGPTQYDLELSWGGVTDLFRETIETPLGRQERMMAAGFFYDTLDGVFGPRSQHCWEYARSELAAAAGQPTLTDEELQEEIADLLQAIIQKPDGTRAEEDDPLQDARIVYPGTFCFNDGNQLGNPLTAHRFQAETAVWLNNLGLGRIPLIATVTDRATGDPAPGVKVCFEFVSTGADGAPAHFVNGLSATTEATQDPTAYVTANLDTAVAGPFGSNCATDDGGRKPDDVFGTLIAEGEVHGFPHQATTDDRPNNFSAVATTGDDGQTGVVLRPSRVAGDTYRLRVHVIKEGAEPDAEEQKTTGLLTIWRQLRLSRIVNKPPVAGFAGAPPVAANMTGALGTITTATMTTEYAKSFHDLVIDRAAATPVNLTAATYSVAVTAARAAINNPRNYDLNALILTGFNSPYMIWLADDVTYNANWAAGTRRLRLNQAGAWQDVANLIDGMIDQLIVHFTAGASPGLTIMRAEVGDSYSYWANPNRPARWRATTSGVATVFRGCHLWYPNSIYTTNMPYPVTVNAMHECGHVLYLRHHYTEGTVAAPASGFSANHDADDMCLMGYLPLTTNDHCGKCVLKLRGWDASRI